MENYHNNHVLKSEAETASPQEIFGEGEGGVKGQCSVNE